MKKSTILLALVFLSACATRPVATESAEEVQSGNLLSSEYSQKKDKSGTVVIKRDAGFGGSACSSRVFVNSKPIADLWPKQKVTVHLQEGNYIFSAWPNGICGGGLSEEQAFVEKNKTQIFRIGYGSNGDYYIVPTAF